MAGAGAEGLRSGESALQVWRQFDLVRRRLDVRRHSRHPRRHLSAEHDAVHHRHRRADPACAQRRGKRFSSPHQRSLCGHRRRRASRQSDNHHVQPAVRQPGKRSAGRAAAGLCLLGIPQDLRGGSRQGSLAPAAVCRRRAGGHDQDRDRPGAAPVADRRLCRVRARPPARVGLGARSDPALPGDRRRRLDGHGHHLIGMHRLSRGIDLHRRPALDAAPRRYR